MPPRGPLRAAAVGPPQIAEETHQRIRLTYTALQKAHDELAGYVAAEANHAKVKKLEKDLRRLYGRIGEVLESCTEKPGASTH